MSCYNYFTIKEREDRLVYVKSEKKNCEITRLMGRYPSPISRELRRNTESCEAYSAIQAEENYRICRKRCVRKEKPADPIYAAEVSELLNFYWPSEQIANRLRKEKNKVRVSTSTIYRALANGILPPELRKILRIKGKQRHSGHKDFPPLIQKLYTG